MALRISQTALINDAALQGYWKMDGDWTDSSSSGYTLTATNSPTFAAGKFGNAGNFASASSQYASIAFASCPNIRITGSQSWVCWINQTTISSYMVPMGLGESDGSSRRGFIIDADSGNSIAFELINLTTNNSVQSTEGAITTSVWTHVAGVYNSATSTLKIYINGVENNSVTASGSTTAGTNGGFSLGARGGNAAFYDNGAIDDAAIFSRALTTAEILNLATGQAGNFLPFM